ncbi:DNA repair protein RecN [Natronincola ferrireducens]|uniref:DNA repair protein RecN n=1 Tax=Natronincola ferrireducens TaxID=393762 RepID=A0A1G9CGE6_9FIRM|nr:DNA repair protein RecN [Natronincola ferrireducens]SDK50719.1 DNA replication and repair protein RecN [Natronincola ferrireducens]
MLLQLEVKNFALIDELNIQFDKGLNILTGETGAGKSIIIDAVNMAIGERADRQFVRTGSKKSMIQAIFSVSEISDLEEVLDEYGIEVDEDKAIIVTREIYGNGRSVSRINGIMVNQGVLKSITQKLIDIHGQHEHQSLLHTEFHIDLLDLYGGKDIHDLLVMLSNKYQHYLKLKKSLESFCYDDMERERKIDLLKFQIEEIETAELTIGEEEELNQKRILLGNSERIYTTLTTTYEDFYNSNTHPSVIDYISKNTKALQSVAGLDGSLSYFYEALEDIQYKIEDIITEIRNYREQIEFDPQILQEIEKRLDTINNLKRKYGSSIQDILDYKEVIQQELDNYIYSEEKISQLKHEITAIKKEIEDLSINISELRIKAGKVFEGQLVDILKSLNMKNVSFAVDIKQLKDTYGNLKVSEKGIDKVEFKLSTNPGEPLKPLAKVASGGEISRVMLALKTILAHIDGIPALIFDEIDTGISGITAQIVGEKLHHISKKRQVICITHLPQIAALANTHFLIEKKIEKNTTKTIVKKLDKDNRLYELGRLLGGEVTEITLKHAEEMIDKAHKKIKATN